MQSRLEVSPGLKAKFKRYLQGQGYEITEEAKLPGKSGVEHTFDLLARKHDGLITRTIAICFLLGGEQRVETDTISSLASKAHDAGIPMKAAVAIPKLSPEARQLAQAQQVKVIEGEKMVALLLDSKSPPSLKPKKPFRFETREQLVESLVYLGYRIKENTKIQGGPGIEYAFDILAYTDTDTIQISQSLGVDFLTVKEEVSLEQVSSFDTKGHDAGIDNKVIVVLTRLSPEARQFAERQQIIVFELGEKPITVTKVTEEEPALPEERPTSIEDKLVVFGTGPSPKLTKHAAQPEALQLIPEVIARRYNAVPLNISGNTLEVAMVDTTDIFALEAFSALSRKRIKPIAASANDVREALDFNYKAYGEIEKKLSLISIPEEVSGEKLAASADTNAPLAQALNLIIDEAAKARASDIHIEPEADRLRVRYRIDGTLQDLMSLPPNIHLALVSRIKILANMNIADRHRPQDGQFSVKTMGRDIDIRVATAPTVSGETAVLRLLDKSMAARGLSELGMLPDCQAKYEAMLKVPYGMILTSGPTGSGKTTTLYASISSLDCVGRNIITIEDPAEYRFKSINQIQVNPQAGITFATGLRSILRLDPNIIMVGEIRDGETAGIAVQSALTGHLMLSSVHANDAASVLPRLIDLGVEPFLVASAVIGVLAQRMVRRLCPDCSHPIEVPLAEQMAYEKEMGEKKTKFLYGTGCKSCSYTGYLGRMVIFEILTMSDDIRLLVTSRASSSQIRAQAVKDGMITMMNDGMRKVQSGMTSPSEVLRSAFSSD